MRGPSISEAAERYLTGRMARGELSPGTAEKVRFAIRQLVTATNDKPIRKLTKEDAEAWMAYIIQVGNIASTRRLRWSYLKVFCEWCVDEDLLQRNPFRQVKPPKPPRRAPQTCSPEEVARVLATVPTLRDRLICMLMVQEGLRCEGVASLQVEDIDFERREFLIREKFGHERRLAITEECWELLDEYLRLWPTESGPLIRAWKRNCWNTAGLPIAAERGLGADTISNYVTRWMYDSGVKKAPRDGRSAHAFRRTCATDMVEMGADLVEVRDVLGHASLATTNLYLGRVAGTRLREAMGGRRYGRPVAIEESA